MLNKLIAIIFFLFFSFSYSQTNEISQIDDILKKSLNKYEEYDFYKSIELGNEALLFSKKINYSKGITVSSVYIAKAFVELGDHNEALFFLFDVEDEPFFLEDICIEIESYRLKGRVYSYLAMYDLAAQKFRKQLFYSKQIENSDEKKLSVLHAYQGLANVYNKKNIQDSINKYLMLQEKNLTFFDDSQYFNVKSETYNQIAKQYIKENNLKLAERYAKKSLDILKANNFTCLFSVFKTLGDLEISKRDLTAAERNYKIALENALLVKDKDAISELYRVLADFYKQNKSDSIKANEYYYKYIDLEDSLKLISNNVLERVYHEVIKDERHKEEKIKSYKYYLLFNISICVIVIAFFYKRKRKLTKLLKQKKIEILFNKSKLADLKVDLQSKKYEKLLLMTKNNNPEFLVAFQDLFPCEVENIKKINPKARASEICFCALAYLNYSTKEIANIQNVTVRAVQVRKNRIRKKYGIPSEIDFNVWMIENLTNK